MVFNNFKNQIANKKTNFKGNPLGNSRDMIVDLLFQNLGNLERGMRGLSKDVKTNVGEIDILAADMVGRIVVVEIGNKEAEELLFRAIDHFDWALTHMKELEEKYKLYNIDPTLAPRIVMLSPSYSEKFIKRASYLNPTFIDIYEYQIKESLGTRNVYFRPFSFLNHRKWVLDLRTKSLEDHLNYLEDLNLREALKSAIVEIQSLRNDLRVDTSKGYISFRKKNTSSILSIYVLKNSFWINFDNRKWNGYLVKEKDDLSELKNRILKAVVEER